MNSLILPPHLEKGDKIYIISPSSRIDPRFLKGAKEMFQQWGYRVVMGKHAKAQMGAYAGSIKQRLADLQKAMDDPDAKVIFCSRGGYGAVHLIDQLDFTAFHQHPKWLVGFSDITALHNRLQYEGFASLHAPMARHLTVEAPDDVCTLHLKHILEGKLPQYSCAKHKLNRKGEATGMLRGGNMAVAHGLSGSAYDIPAEGTVLFIEDIGERPHAIERMMYNLKLKGTLARLSGLIVGQFTEYRETEPPMMTVYESIASLVKEYDYPVCFDFPVGHVACNLPLINGCMVDFKVDSKGASLSFRAE